MDLPALLRPLALRGLTLPNRLVVAPMCQYSVTDGEVGDYHLVHLGRFALGGFGLVLVEATGVTPEGRISHGDVGLWHDGQVPGLPRVSAFLHAHGAAAGIQLAHAGSKATSRRPWEGGGPVTADDARPGEPPWATVSASAVPPAPGHPTPRALTVEELADVREAFVAATRRAVVAGFDVVEVPAAHGYLLNQFLPPLTNRRDDGYGGSRRRACASPWRWWRRCAPPGRPTGPTSCGPPRSTARVRASRSRTPWPSPASCAAAGWTSSTSPAAGSAAAGSTRSVTGTRCPSPPRSAAGRKSPRWAVGLIVDARRAEAVVAGGQADLVALGREAQDDPNAALHAARELSGGSYDAYPVQAGPRLASRDRLLDRLGPWSGPGPVQVVPSAPMP